MGTHKLEKSDQLKGMEFENADETELGQVQLEENEKEAVQAADKIELNDIGKGLILLGSIILICYIVLLTISVIVEVEPGQMIWTMPSYLVPTVTISIVLIFVGLVIVAITRENEED